MTRLIPHIGGMRWLAVAVAVVAGFFAVSVLAGGQTASRKRQSTPKETYTRPKPTRPLKPEIGGVNRYRDDKVFLEQADSLYKRDELENYQIVKGSVKFRQAGMWMFCDSAYYFPDANSLDAFGHVRMQQGDTLFVYADKLFYNGNDRMALLRCGSSERVVKMINRDVMLTTDSFDYDLGREVGWYSVGGTLKDRDITLRSVYGQYSPATKEAEFYHDVVLDNPRDGYRLLSDTLLYNTATHIAEIVSPTRIIGTTDTVLTSQGTYNIASDLATLTSRSTIIHRDSNSNVTTLEGDSIIYDKATRVSRAYSFRDGRKLPAPVVLTDTARKTTLIGGFAMYNDSTGYALSTGYPLLMEYSRPDTLFLRADTILTYIERHDVFPDSTSGFFFALPDTAGGMRPYTDSLPPLEVEIDLTGSIPAERVVEPGRVSLPLPPLSSADGHGGENRPLPTLERDSGVMIPKDFRVIEAIRYARFFNQEVQGVADTLRYVEFDSILYMYRKPVVWSGERQVAGNEIHVHLNDSTADWALLPKAGIMGEHVEEDFYNQMSGNVMKAWFENNDLRRLEVEGNVQVLFLPQDNDSTFSRMVNAESNFLTLETTDRKLDKLKMWPDVSGSTTPLFMVKKSQKLLPGFRWYESIRPVREWYGDRWHWADDLGEVSEELERYFNEAESDLGTGYRNLSNPTAPPPPAEPSGEVEEAPASGESVEESTMVITSEGEVIEGAEEPSRNEGEEVAP